MKNKIYIIINSDYFVNEWEYNCLLKLKNQNLVFLIANEIKAGSFNKNNRKYLKNFIYYLINLISIRQKKLQIKFNSFKNASIKEIYFKKGSNLWERIEKDSIKEIIEGYPSFIFKCGMGLLYIDNELKNIPILSFHHGDPSRFRGRPAGFYELLNGEKKIGQILQVLSNKIDSGKILCYGESEVYPWSYKKTLKDVYKISPIIFEKGLQNLDKGIFINKENEGLIYKLPSNIVAIKFIFREIFSLISKVSYGLFTQKYWQVAYLKNIPISRVNHPIEFFDLIDSLKNNFQSLKTPRGYRFLADPFIIDSKIIVEGLKINSCKGDLLLMGNNQNTILNKINLKGRHLSYPYTQEFKLGNFIYPDSGSLKNAILYSGKSPLYLKKSTMKFFKKGLCDPSILKHNGYFYLFANYPNEKYVLRLWISLDPYFNSVKEHNKSPIFISPEGGRSGGRIFKLKNKLYRFGQDCTGSYGNGLILFEIESLDQENYCEKKISKFKLQGSYRGPHNIDFSNDLLTWDYYEEKFNIMSGINRIKGIWQGEN